ncbi:MAG: hypothetical protein H7144_18510 [Burkholderiales bacterium]|nr:hypothetical protein [Phycisphaerae bacterium]
MLKDRSAVVREDRSKLPLLAARLHLSRLSLAVLLAAPVIGADFSLAQSTNVQSGGQSSVQQRPAPQNGQPNGQTPIFIALQDSGSVQTPLLSNAIEQYKAGLYEESLAALQGIKPEALTDADRKVLTETIAQAEQAVQLRRGARADFEKGEAALAANQNAEAANLYKSVISNQYADAGTRKKAQEQLAVAQAGGVAVTGTGNGGGNGVGNGAGVAATETDAKATYDSAVRDYKAGQYDQARTKFTALQNQGYKAAWFDKSPREYLELLDKNQTPTSGKEQARAAYLSGRDLYKKGDWIAARQNFNKAVELGYKPGWFEDAPAKYLAIMDKKEQADAQQAAREAVAATPVMVAPVDAGASTPSNQTPTDQTPGVTPTPGSEVVLTPVNPVTPDAGTPTVAPMDGSQATPPTDGTAGVTPTDPVTPTANTDQEALMRLAAENEAKIQQARSIVDNARAAENAQNLNSAADLYSKALELDASNADALAGRNRTLQSAGLSPVQQDLATRQEQVILAQRQAIIFSFEQALAQADLQITDGRFDAARSAITQAEVASKSNPGIFRNEEIQQFDQRLADARVRLEQSVITQRDVQAREAKERAVTDAREREIAQIAAREQAISTLIADSRRLVDQGKYNEALKTVNQILTIDARNEYAIGIKPILFDRATLQLQRNLRETFGQELVRTFTETEEQKIPYSGILNYPPNWPDLAERRDRTVRDERSITDADAVTGGLLEKSLPEIRFQDVAFSDVIDFLRDTTQANIFVNWKALEAAGIDRNAPVSTRLRNVKFSKVLRTILESVGGGATSQVSYTVDEGVITISTIEDLARNVETRTYDIRDLIISIPDFQQPNVQNNNDTGTDVTVGGDNGGGGGGGGGGGNLFGGAGGEEQQNEEDQLTRTDLVEQITSLIRETIGVGTWKEDGGQLGTLRELTGQLVVTQTPEVHQQIQQLLEKLREQRSIQVTIETRFLTVQKNFLEDVGVDFDFSFNNTDNAFSGIVPGTGPLPIGFDGQTQTGVGPIQVGQSSAAFTQASTLQTGVSGNLAGSFANPNLTTTVNAFLDDFQASILIRATQGNQSVTNLTAPRLTLFNGQTATINVDRVISYVSSLRPVVAQGAVGFQTVIRQLTSGITLGVTATVSADRKYVTLTLTPTLTRLNGITNFPVIGTAAQVDQNGNPIPGTSTQGFVQLPDISRQRVRTSVSVPDGGTLLLGGATVTGEIEREAGVPVLSKIPFLKRVFTNRSTATDESILLILVKPTIIIQREIEQETFPLLSSRAG